MSSACRYYNPRRDFGRAPATHEVLANAVVAAMLPTTSLSTTNLVHFPSLRLLLHRAPLQSQRDDVPGFVSRGILACYQNRRNDNILEKRKKEKKRFWQVQSGTPPRSQRIPDRLGLRLILGRTCCKVKWLFSPLPPTNESPLACRRAVGRFGRVHNVASRHLVHVPTSLFMNGACLCPPQSSRSSLSLEKPEFLPTTIPPPPSPASDPTPWIRQPSCCSPQGERSRIIEVAPLRMAQR